jgi:hypothetical protein
LSQAILEAYSVLNLYRQVIDTFGNVTPFSQIVFSEQQQVRALTQTAEQYGMSVPANPGLAAAPTFKTLNAACTAGADAEWTQAALIDQLKPAIRHSDILQVFDNLQKASLKNHLPSFQTCQSF